MQNRRISAIPISIEEARRKLRPRNNVVFLEDEEVINPGFYFYKRLLKYSCRFRRC